jgi:hypothetical protein
MDRYQGNRVKTFCCDSKDSYQARGSIIGINFGKNCTPSLTGQCNVGYGVGQNYKFRCYNTQMIGRDQNGNPTVGYRIKINESDDGEQCKYVAGTLGKIGTGVASLGNWGMFRGGTKYMRKRSTRRHRTNKRK